MKHNIGPSQYSTFHSYAQSHAIPFNYGSLAGTIATAHNLQMGLNERKEEARKAEAAQSKREIAEAKQMAYQAEQDWDKMEQSQYMVSAPAPQNISYQQAMDITGNASGVNRFSGHRSYQGFAPEPVQQSFFDTYVSNHAQLDDSYPLPTYTEMGAGRPIMPPGYQAPVMAPTTSPQNYFKPFGGYHEGYNQSGYPFGGF